MRSWFNRQVAALLFLGVLAGPAFAQSRIDELSAGAAVSGTDTIPICQGCGASVAALKATMTQILTYINANLSAVTSVATTSPITGGTITATGTIACATCATSAAALTNHAPVIGAGSQGEKTVAAMTNGQLLIGSTGADPAPGTVAAGTPNLVWTGSAAGLSLATTNAQNSPADGGSHSYTVLSGDAAKEVILASTFTGMAVPQATGSFAAGYSFTGVNKGAITATSTTSTVNGIAGATGIKLGANQVSSWDSDGTNWLVGLGLPQPAAQTGATLLHDDMTWGAATLAQLATQATNTVVGNATSGTAVPTALAVGTCSTAASALNWTTNTGFGCNTAVDAAKLAGSTPGTGVATAIAANLSAAGGLTTTIAAGTSALGTSAISSAACASVVTTAATNTATTDVVLASFNGDPTAVTGYIPATAGMLTIISYPTSGNVNFKVCNNTNASVTPGAITLNWRVVR